MTKIEFILPDHWSTETYPFDEPMNIQSKDDLRLLTLHKGDPLPDGDWYYLNGPFGTTSATDSAPTITLKSKIEEQQ